MEEGKCSWNAYKNEEEANEKWLAENRAAIVFNHFGGSKTDKYEQYNKIHLAHCYTLHLESDSGKRTLYEKICSNDLVDLEEKVQALRSDSYSFCKAYIKIQRRCHIEIKRGKI